MRNVGIYFLIGIAWTVGGFTVCPGSNRPLTSADFAFNVMIWPIAMPLAATQIHEQCQSK